MLAEESESDRVFEMSMTGDVLPALDVEMVSVRSSSLNLDVNL